MRLTQWSASLPKMKLECKILLQNGSHNQARSPKPVKGFVTLGEKRSKDATTHYVQVSTQQNRNQTPIQLSRENIADIKSKFIAKGLMTLEFKNPNLNLFISEANPDRLRVFFKAVIAVVKGERVECNKLEEIKSTDFQQISTYRALNRRDYTTFRSQGYPSSLTELTLNNCEIKIVEARWFLCKKLVRLDLSGNQFGGDQKEIAKLLHLKRLVNLKELNLSRTNLLQLPFDITLPQSLLSLDLSFNQLTWFPRSILSLGNLQRLNISSNSITKIPPEIVALSLATLDLSNNQIRYLPYCMSRRKLQSCFLGGNNPGPPFQSKPQMTSLLGLALAKVKGISHDVLEIPWDVRLLESSLIQRCSVCMQFVGSNSVHNKAVFMNPLDFATSVDSNAAFPMELVSCRGCVPSIRHLLRTPRV